MSTGPELDTLALAQEAVRDGFISQNVLDQLTSLHPQVPNSMKHRYLQACFQAELEYRKKNNIMVGKFIKYMNPAPSTTADDLPLGPEHLSDLNELLVSYAFKWKELGIALRFQPQDLDSIQALFHNSPSSYLTRLLGDWLLRKLQHTLLPTKANLEEALKSKTVGLGALACKLNNKVCENTVSSKGPYSIITVPLDDSDNNSALASGSVNVVIEENMLTLIEIETVSSRKFECKYKWFMNDVELPSYEPYQFSKQVISGLGPFLCLCADIDRSGSQFYCEITIIRELDDLEKDSDVNNIDIDDLMDRSRSFSASDRRSSCDSQPASITIASRFSTSEVTTRASHPATRSCGAARLTASTTRASRPVTSVTRLPVKTLRTSFSDGWLPDGTNGPSPPGTRSSGETQLPVVKTRASRPATRSSGNARLPTRTTRASRPATSDTRLSASMNVRTFRRSCSDAWLSDGTIRPYPPGTRFSGQTQLPEATTRASRPATSDTRLSASMNVRTFRRSCSDAWQSDGTIRPSPPGTRFSGQTQLPEATTRASRPATSDTRLSASMNVRTFRRSCSDAWLSDRTIEPSPPGSRFSGKTQLPELATTRASRPATSDTRLPASATVRAFHKSFSDSTTKAFNPATRSYGDEQLPENITRASPPVIRPSGDTCLPEITTKASPFAARSYADSQLPEIATKASCPIMLPVNTTRTSRVLPARTFTTKSLSITLNVSCLLDEFKESLRFMYLVQPEVPEDSWPPVGNKKYINLALIKQDRINYGSEYARLTIRGDVDDVLQHKDIIKYEDVYKSLKSRQLVLIEGRPGSGKTTFVHKLTQDWATNSGGPIRLLLLVSLRVLNNLNTISDVSGILNLFKDLKVSKEFVEKHAGKGVCFIFDGLDEFSPPDGDDSIIHQIIRKAYLTQSTVIVASRPAAIAKLMSRADKVIEVVGFLKEQIFEYFNYYPFSDTSKPAKLKFYLKSHPNILHMCYLPIHAAMVAFLFEVTGTVPKTETEIYTHFTRFTLMRTIAKDKKVDSSDVDLNRLTGNEQVCFNQICRLAFDKTLSNKQVLREDEVGSYFQVKNKCDMSLGLITVDRTAGLYGFKDIYTFLHLTFQEYLAAYHISTLSDEEQSKVIEEHGYEDHMLIVWKFFCGLKKSEATFKLILDKTKGDSLFHIQSAYESQQRSICEELMKFMKYHIQLEQKHLTASDFTSISYITNFTVLPFKLSLIHCNFNVEAVDALQSEMNTKTKTFLQKLYLKSDNTETECLRKLLNILPSLKCINVETQVSVIRLTSTELSVISTSMSALPRVFNNLSYTKLNNLILRETELNEALINLHHFTSCDSCPAVAKLLNGLLKCHELQTLDLRANGISSDNFSLISDEYFTKLTKLKQLYLDANELGDTGIKALSSTLQHLPSLQELSLRENCIFSDDGEAEALAANLRHHCEQFQQLNLSDNDLGVTTSREIMHSLKHCDKFKTLILSKSVVSDTLISEFSQCKFKKDHQNTIFYFHQ